MAQAQTSNASTEAALKAAQTALTTVQKDIAQTESEAKVKRMNLKNDALAEQNRHTAAMNALKESLAAAKNEQQKASIALSMTEEAARSDYQLKLIQHDQQILDAQIQSDQFTNDRNLLKAKLQLDKAQKEYDLGLQIQAQKYTENLERLKSQVSADLLNNYDMAYYDWQSQSASINNLNFQIGQMQVQLQQRKAADQLEVDLRKKNLDLEKDNLAKLNDDLAKFKAALPNVEGLTALIGQYQGEVTNLKNTDILLNQNITESQKNANDLSSRLTAFQTETLTPASTALAEANRNVQNAKIWLDNATDALNNTTGSITVHDFVNKSDIIVPAGYQPKLNGAPDGLRQRVALKDAVVTEEADADENGTYPSPADQKDVLDAQSQYDTFKKFYDDAKANYDNSYALWETARTAYTTAHDGYLDLNKLFTTANTAWMNYQNQWSANENRIRSITNYIQTLSMYRDNANYSDPATNMPIFYTQITRQITDSELRVKSFQTQYDAAVASFEQQKPMNEVSYANMQAQIDLLNATVESKKNELALLKATLDEWTAKITAALPQN
jgi:hypothetical protein